MPDFAQAMANPTDLSEAAQVKAGAPIKGDMGDDQKNFVKIISQLLESGEIDAAKPETFLNQNVYAALDPEWKTKTDLSLANIAILLGHIYEFYKSKQTPDACPQLGTMIEELWQMKERIEEHANVFKF